MRTIWWALALAGTVLTPAAPASSQNGEPRLIEVPATASWRHAATGMQLPAEALGLSRARVADSTDAELDVVATYFDRGQGLMALVYIYRTAAPDVALWFDRQLAAIVAPEAGLPPISGFTRPGASVASGLRGALPDNVPGMRSTAIAIAPLGSWLVKIRMASTRLEPAALDERLTAFAAALGWPAESGTARAAVPVQACATPLRLRAARVVRAEFEDVLMDAVAPSAAEQGEAGPPPVYCREPGATAAWGVYRPDGAADRYLIALNDAGFAIEVAEAIDLSALLGERRSRRRYTTTLLGRNAYTSYPSFDRLPPPEQAIELVRNGSPLSTTTSND